jgi:hypothetical protein
MPQKPSSEHHYMESHNATDGDGEIRKFVSEAFSRI